LTRLPHRSPTATGWVLLKRGPRKPVHYPHHTIYPLFRISTHTLNTVEVWPHAQGRLCCPARHHFKATPTSLRPLPPLAGFTRLDGGLPQAEPCGDAGISGLSSVICHRMPMALPRVPARCLCPLLPWQLWPSPSIYRIGEYPHSVGFVPQSDSPSYVCPIISYEAAPFA
jgi:hypothetical protein